MKARRTLTLKSEHLSALSADDLRDVHGAEATKLCVSDRFATCRISDYIMSLCGCLTGYCSIDVC